jgi:hypothetical protein
MHDAENNSCFDEEENEEIHHFSHEPLKRRGNTVFSTCKNTQNIDI